MRGWIGRTTSKITGRLLVAGALTWLLLSYTNKAITAILGDHSVVLDAVVDVLVCGVVFVLVRDNIIPTRQWARYLKRYLLDVAVVAAAVALFVIYFR